MKKKRKLKVSENTDAHPDRRMEFRTTWEFKSPKHLWKTKGACILIAEFKSKRRERLCGRMEDGQLKLTLHRVKASRRPIQELSLSDGLHWVNPKLHDTAHGTLEWSGPFLEDTLWRAADRLSEYEESIQNAWGDNHGI